MKEVKTALVSDKDPMLMRKDLDLLLEVFESLVQENKGLRNAVKDLTERVLRLEEGKGKKRFRFFSA